MKYLVVKSEGIPFKNKQYILLNCRDENGKRKIIRIPFKPWFAVGEYEAGKQFAGIVGYGDQRIIGTDKNYYYKCYTRLSRDVGKVRNKFRVRGLDSTPVDVRCRVDKDIFAGVMIKDGKIVPCEPPDIPQHRFYFDIEVNSGKTRKPNPNTARYPIPCICAYDNITNKGYAFVLNTNGGYIPEMLDIWEMGIKVDVEVFEFDSERELLSYFIQFIREIDPDTPIGYNSDKFDWPYLIKRMEYFDLPVRDMSPFKLVYMRGNSQPRIAGRNCFDFYEGFKKFMKVKGELRSKKLKKIIKEYMGIDRPDYGKEIWRLVKERRYIDMITYCFLDSFDLHLLAEQFGVMDFFETNAKIVGCNLRSTLLNGVMVTTLVLRESKNELVYPTKVKDKSEKKKKKKKPKGAMVFEPIRGIHEWVGLLDLKSLYVTIMRRFNISTETLDPEGEIELPNGTRFTNKFIGVIPRALKKLNEWREKCRDLRDNATDPKEKKKWAIFYQGLKFLTVSFFGVFGDESFIGFNKKAFEGITLTGQYFIKGGAKFLFDEYGWKVHYGDTDSIFEKFYPMELGYEAAEKLNVFYERETRKISDLEADPIKINFEKYFRRVLLFKKKRYAGHLIMKDGKEKNELYVKGFDIVRSDASEYTIDLQKQVFQSLLIDLKTSVAKKAIRKKILEIEDQDIETIATPKGLSMHPSKYSLTVTRADGKTYKKKPQAHVRGSKYANKHLNEDIVGDTKPMYFWVNKNCLSRKLRKNIVNNSIGMRVTESTDVVSFIEVDNVPEEILECIDYKKMVKTTIEAKVKEIMEQADIDWTEVLTGTRQTKLGAYV